MKLIRYNYPQTSGAVALSRLLGFEAPSFERFGAPLEGVLGSAAGCYRPAADLFEDDSSYFVRMELPGIRKETIDLELEDSVLTIRSQAAEQDGDVECAYSFRRGFSVPDGVEFDQIAASYQDGVLTVTMPKTAVQPARKITVN